MFLGKENNLIFEGKREAFMAAHLLHNSNSELIKSITPPIENRSISLLEFLSLVRNRRNDEDLFVVSEEKSIDMVKALGETSIPSNVATKNLSPEHFIGYQLIQLAESLGDNSPFDINIVPKF